MGPVAILGYGRFGQALAERLQDADVVVRAWDPRIALPREVATASPAEAVAKAQLVVLAVPVPQTRAALTQIAPHLTADQTVIEAGSVKVGPVADLTAVLGSRVPWVATHPLFGPISLALGERPLAAVVCPNPLHRDAEGVGVAFWRDLGCRVLRMDPEGHDRDMARTHALGFFVAQGFIDCGIEMDREFLPASTAGIARTMRSAAAAAGPLFETLQRDNPYANDARARLLEALTALDARCRAPAVAEDDDAAQPQLPAPPPQLLEVRELIDDVDAELIRLLQRRAALALKAGSTKARHGRGIVDPRREDELLAERRALAAAAGLDPDAVDEVFRAIVRFSRHHQSIHQRGPSPP